MDTRPLLLAALMAAAFPSFAATAADSLASSPLKIASFRIEGAQALPESELQAVLTPFLGGPLDQAALRRAGNALEQHYLARRLLARAVMPPQDVTKGVVRVQIVEGHFGKIRQGKPVSTIGPERSASLLSHYLGQAQWMQLDRLDEASGQLNSWPGVVAETHLVSGEKPGEIDVRLDLSERKPWSGTLRADNEGARSTGSPRALLDVETVLPGGGGQTLGGGLAVSEGSQQLHLDVSTPIPLDSLPGLRAGLYGSALRYRLVTPEFNALDVKGPSNTFGARLDLAAQRRSNVSSDVSLQWEQRRFDNQSMDVSLARYKLDVLSLTASRRITSPESRATTSAALTLSTGRVDLDGSPNETDDALGPRTAGRYALARLSLQHWRPISATQSLLLRATVQAASRNLDVSERLSATGAQAVRAYPLGEAYGTRGGYASADWQFNLAGQGHPDTSLALFVDWAYVQQYKNGSFPGAPSHNVMSLGGAGAWVEWQPRPDTSLRLTVAQPVGGHPNALVNGHNQDGSRIGTRVWASAQWSF